jgi:hypothetical protein
MRLTLLLLLALPLSAQLPLKWASPRYPGDPWLTTGLSLNYAANVGDAVTTRLALADGAVERNPVLRPLYARAPGAAEALKFSFVGVATWTTKRLRDGCASRSCRVFTRVLAFSEAGFAGWLTYHNYQVAVQCRRGCR